LDCRSGYGTRILSNVAKKCIGMERNIEAVKYANRNFFVEGRNKFLIGHEIQDLINTDVIVSFNRESNSKESLSKLLNLLGDRRQDNSQVIILGMSKKKGQEFGASLRSLNKICTDLSLVTSLYQQGATNSLEVEQYDENNPTIPQRIIAIVRFKADSPIPHFAQAVKKKQDLVSIVIPTYNRADLISESIDSALNQTYPAVEVIVIDDGSTDNTREVIAKYGNRIRYYRKPNGGIGSALNFGINKMNGRWFKWLSSDDVLTLDAVDTLVSYADETGAMVIYSDYDIIDDSGNLVSKFVEPHFPSYYEFASALWTRFIGNGSSSLIEKYCFEDVGLFDETLRSAEDYDWWLRACLSYGYRFFHLRKKTLKYRTHANQLTTVVKHNAYATDEKIRNKVKEQIISANPAWWDILASHQRTYLRQHEHRSLARRMLRKSLLHMPEGLRKSALSTWQRSLKARVDGEE
jgi:glycosyltransferase involved in cell wall biosynthesis